MVQRHLALGVGHLGNRHAADLAVLQGHHLAKLPGQHQLRGFVAVAGGQYAVVGRGVTAALNVAQHGGAHLAVQVGLQLLAQDVANTAQAYWVGAAWHVRLHGLAITALLGPFANADDGVALALFAAAAGGSDGGHVVIHLGQQDHIGPAGQPRLQHQPAGVAAHGFDNHHAVVAVGRAFDPVQGLGDGGHGRIKAKAALAVSNIVVNGLGHAHAVHARGLGHAVRQAHGAIAANGHHHLQPQRLHIGLHLGQGGGIFQGIGAVAGAQNGAAPVQDARDIVPAQRPCLRLRGHQAFKTVGNAQHLALAIADQGFGHGADDGVQSGAVAAAGEDANFHGGSLSYSRAGSKRSACW